MPIVYNKGYNITACGVEKMHPFDSTKYKRIWAFLQEGDVIDFGSIRCYHEVELPSRRWLIEVMNFCYLYSLNYSIFVSRYVELPIFFLPGFFLRSQLLEPMSLATKGSVEAAYLAMTRGWAINLSGGFHHASRSSGEGFCVYPDITFITNYLRKVYCIRRILIIDLDAHQGNGHERDHLLDNNTYIIDAYNHRIYPGDHKAKRAISYDIDLNIQTTDQEFLVDVNNSMATCLRDFQPEFVIYNAGTDCLVGDPLGRLGISWNGIIQRDEEVFNHCLKTPLNVDEWKKEEQPHMQNLNQNNNVPIVMLMSGGYQQSNAEVIAKSIENLFLRFDLQNQVYLNKYS